MGESQRSTLNPSRLIEPVFTSLMSGWLSCSQQDNGGNAALPERSRPQFGPDRMPELHLLDDCLLLGKYFLMTFNLLEAA